MNPVAEAVITKNLDAIATLILFYEEHYNLVPFIRIETGTYGRNLIEPDLSIERLHLSENELFAQVINPHTQIARLREKVEDYQNAYATARIGSAVICIDYESDGVREYFDPIVFALDEKNK